MPALEAAQLNPELAIKAKMVGGTQKNVVHVDYRHTIFLKDDEHRNYIILRQFQYEGSKKYKYFMLLPTIRRVEKYLSQLFRQLQ